MLGSRRNRPPNPPLTAATANPNAAMAAAAVFKKRDSQQSTLSSAAAAAALRARPMTPTNVAQVQTKRTQRRSASVSSAGTAPEMNGRPSLHRRGSSASMTERTFRSPSPGGRRASVSDDRQLAYEAPPPVPPLPQHVDTRSAKADKHRKTQSVSNPPFRVASQELEETREASWYGGAHVGDLSNVRTSDAVMTNPPMSPPPRFAYEDEDRPDSRSSSVNFSYPSRSRIGSPVSPTTAHFELPPTQDRGEKRSSSVSSSAKGRRPASTSAVESLVYDPNSRRMVPRVDTYALEQEAAKLTRKKKTKQIPKTGTHLSQGTMGRTRTAPETAAHIAAGHAAQEQQEMPHRRERIQEPQQQANEQPSAPVRDRSGRDVSRERAPAVVIPEETRRVPSTTHAALPQQKQHVMEEKTLITSPRSDATKAQQQQSPEAMSPANEVDADDAMSAPRDRWPPDGLRRQPSTVKEEPEPDSDEDQSQAGQAVSAALDAVPARQKVYSGQLQQAQPPRPIAASSAPATKPRAASLQPPMTTRVQRERSNSNGSPARTARFGGVTGGLAVKHSPPARSVSPRKSALKSSVSPSRGASPDNMSETSSGFNRHDEGSVQRKKSVRVSFDDENTVVAGQPPSQALGEQSPSGSSPQQSGRKPWFSNIGRSKKQESVPLEDDGIMQPRPVLPSFGSVRDKKPRETAPQQEGRPLVRPTVEPFGSPSLPASPELLPAVAHVSGELEQETRAISTGTGGDYAVPVTQTESDKARVAANTSRFREPLPPVVTSIEGSAFASDSTSSDDEETAAPLAQTATNMSEGERFSTPEPVHKEEGASGAVLAAEHPNVPMQTTMAPEAHPAVVQNQEKAVEPHIPIISISQPTPQPMASSTPYFLGVPGGFPEDDSPVASPQELEGNPIEADPETALGHTSEETYARQAIFEPVSQAADTAQSPHTPATATATSPLTSVIEEEDDTGSSIYSDAPDHFTDSDEEGFLSLNAVVDRPVDQGTSKVDGQEPFPPFPAHMSTATTAVESPTGELTQYDWDKAKAYWRSLTAERRAQLEKEAVDDAGIEGDREERNQSATKGKKKKSVEQRTSERQALAVHLAQQTMAEQQQKQREAEATVATKTAPAKKTRNSERMYQIKPGTKVPAKRTTPLTPLNADEDRAPIAPSQASEPAPKLKKSMRTNGAAPRGPQPDQSKRTLGMAGRSLRSGGGAGSPGPEDSRRLTGMAAKTLRSGGALAAPNDRGPRRVSSPPLPTGTSAANTALYTAMNSGSVAAPSLRRRDSTDSESSFRRVRLAQPSQGFGFRKSLRQPSPSPTPARREPAPKPASSRFSLRSLSPTGSQFHHGSPQSMRTSLRGSAKEAKGSGGGLHFGGFGKSSAKAAPKASSRSSRFDDSSDDDEKPRKGGFRSRFDDSSDEDERQPLPAPSQSMPKSMRTMRSDKSAEAGYQTKPAVRRHPSALAEEEESDLDPYVDEKPAAASALQAKTMRSGSADMVNLPTIPPTRPAINEGAKSPSSRRGSFMSVLRRKKNKRSEGIARPERMDSAARRDTNLERSAAELETIRRSGDLDREVEPDLVRPLSPRRLSKRTHSMQLDAVVSPGGTNWPLPTPGQERPGTSGNLGTRTMSVRPAQRRSMSANLLEGAAGGEGKKKKKFGALRKMFGLDD